MERTHASRRKPLLAVLILSCLLLLLPLVSSAPLSRTLSLRRNHQPDEPDLKVPVQSVVGADQVRNHGEVAARMDIEVNDYPGSGANNRHEPRSPGRA